MEQADSICLGFLFCCTSSRRTLASQPLFLHNCQIPLPDFLGTQDRHIACRKQQTHRQSGRRGVQWDGGGGWQRKAGEQAETALDFNEALGAWRNLIRWHSGDNNIGVRGLVRGHMWGCAWCESGKEKEEEAMCVCVCVGEFEIKWQMWIVCRRDVTQSSKLPNNLSASAAQLLRSVPVQGVCWGYDLRLYVCVCAGTSVCHCEYTHNILPCAVLQMRLILFNSTLDSGQGDETK